MIKRLSQREKIIFIICIVVVVVYVGFNGVVKPLKEQISVIDNKIIVSQVKLNKNHKIIRKAKKLDKLYGFYQSKYKQTKTNEQVMSSLLSEIEKVAGNLDLQISDLKPRKVKKEQYHNRFSVSLTLNANMQDTIQYIYLLQTQPSRFIVDEIRFDKSTRKKSDSLRASLVLSKIFLSQ